MSQTVFFFFYEQFSHTAHVGKWTIESLHLLICVFPGTVHHMSVWKQERHTVPSLCFSLFECAILWPVPQ